MLRSVPKLNGDVETLRLKPLTQPTSFSPVSERLDLDTMWRTRRKRKSQKEAKRLQASVADARQLRVEAQAALDATVAKRDEERETVIKPLVRTRNALERDNHIADMIARSLRREA